MKKIAKEQTSLATLDHNLSKFYEDLNVEHFKKCNKFIYDPQYILSQFSSLLKPLIIYVIIVKFPLLLSLNNGQVNRQYDKQIKKQYQTFICERKLVVEFQFQFFTLVAVKCGKQFIQREFQQLQFTQQDERQMYCIMIKILLGLIIHQKAYTIIEKKFIDSQKIQNYPIIQPTKRIRQSESRNENKSSRKLISLNRIQAKLQRRKQNRFKKNERSSINSWRNSNQIDQFKENLMKQLRVINQTGQKIKRIKYQALQKKNSHPIQKEKELREIMKNQYFKRNVIHTQQISSSLELNLMMNEFSHSYTRRNIAIRLTDSTPRFSHQVYQVSPSNRITQPGEIEKMPLKMKETASVLSKKTKTYWKKMACKMRQINNSFEY